MTRLYLFDERYLYTGYVDADPQDPAYAEIHSLEEPPSNVGPGEAAMWYENGWNIVLESSVPKALSTTKLTKLAFRNRFTSNEKALIEFAATDNPAAPTPERLQSAGLRAYLKDLDSATFVDLSRQDTVASVRMMEQLGLIGSGRANVIIQTTITNAERYNG